MDSINDIVRKLRENRILSERKDYTKYPREDLIKMAQEGDQLAVETLIDTHEDFIRRMSSKYFISGAEEEDVVQLATIAFWEAIMSFNNSGNFEAYAGMIIKRALVNEIDKAEAGKSQIHNLANRLEDTLNDDGEGGEQTLGDTIPAKGDSTEDKVVAHELEKAIDKYLEDTFTRKEREVIEKYIEGYKVSEIAEVLGMPYKQTENILYKIKYKLKEYLKNNSYRESRKYKQGKNIEFSDEEKRILESSLARIKKKEYLKESVLQKLKESYEDYTEAQFDEELDNIEFDIGEITSEMRETYYDDRDNLLDQLDDLRSKLQAMEEYLTTEQYAKSEDLLTDIGRAEDIEYEGPDVYTDPYASRGLSRSDF